jgi:DNA-binding winged helix-turn-helix (wHTH) protein
MGGKVTGRGWQNVSQSSKLGDADGLRRPNNSSCSEGTLRIGPIYLDLGRFTVQVNGKTVNLTRLEFDLLAYLMQHAHRVVSKDELVCQVIHGVYSAESSLIRVHISHLRRKLGMIDAIETVRGRGLRFSIQNDRTDRSDQRAPKSRLDDSTPSRLLGQGKS